VHWGLRWHSAAAQIFARAAAGGRPQAAVESDAGMVVTSQHLASEVRCSHFAPRRKRRIDAAVAVGLRPCRHSSLLRQSRRRGLHDDPLAGRSDTFYQFSRAGAAGARRGHVSGRARAIRLFDKSLEGYLA